MITAFIVGIAFGMVIAVVLGGWLEFYIDTRIKRALARRNPQ